jgi:hypothetical protein
MLVSHSSARFASVLAAAIAAPLVLTAAEQPSRRDADQMRQKVAAIMQLSERPRRDAVKTTVTEPEVNAYLALDARNELPAGVVDPVVSILGSGRVTGHAVVDLDAVRKQKNPTSMFDPASYLTGRVPVEATGVLTTSNGVGRFQLESATVGGLPVPKMVLQEIVSHYSRTAQNPSGINLDDPFPLPSRIREIQVERGHAIVVQ